MAKLTGLFQRGSIYYVRVVLPIKHPLRAIYKSGKVITSIGELKRKEAEIIGMIKRAEILGHSILTNELTEISKTNAHQIYLRDVYKRWKEATPRSQDSINACGRALKLYEEFTNNPPIKELTRIMGDGFRSWLQDPIQGTTSKTAKDRMTWVKSLLKYAHVELELIKKNPWDGLNIHTKTTYRRRPWSAAELQIIFNQKLFTSYELPKDKKAGADAAYWIPLLGLYTGARLGELAQLTTTDIQTEADIQVLSITNEGEIQQVKTAAGIRKIPIHKELLRLGFIDYVEHIKSLQHLSLWPHLPKRKNKPGGYFSNWFGTWKSTLGLTTVDFHSFRHTARSQLAYRDISEPIIDALLGHEIQGSTGAKVYTHSSLIKLNNAIQTIQYEELKLLKTWKFKTLKPNPLD